MQRQGGRKGRVQSQHEWDAVTDSEGVFMKAPLPVGARMDRSAAVRHEASSCHLVTISPRALNSALQLHQRPLACHTCQLLPRVFLAIFSAHCLCLPSETCMPSS